MFPESTPPWQRRCTGRFRDEPCRLYAYRSQRDGHSSGGGNPLRYPQSGACPASGAPLWKYRPWKDRKPGSFESGSFLKAGHRQRLDKGGADFESSGFQISTRISLSYRRALLLSWQMDLLECTDYEVTDSLYMYELAYKEHNLSDLNVYFQKIRHTATLPRPSI